MSATNHTTNYGLSQFLGTDKPAWLVDYNGDMALIDQAIKDASDSASSAQSTANTADGKADTNASNISTLNDQINGASGIATDVTTLQGSVNTINSLIGNGEPTTTDKTLIGAINELHSDVQNIHGSNIDEYSKQIEITADGVKDCETLVNEALTAFKAVIDAGVTGNAFYLEDVTVEGAVFKNFNSGVVAPSGNVTAELHSINIAGNLSTLYIKDINIASNVLSSYDVATCTIADGSWTAVSRKAEVPSNGSKVYLRYAKYSRF